MLHCSLVDLKLTFKISSHDIVRLDFLQMFKNGANDCTKQPLFGGDFAGAHRQFANVTDGRVLSVAGTAGLYAVLTTNSCCRFTCVSALKHTQGVSANGWFVMKAVTSKMNCKRFKWHCYNKLNSDPLKL